MVEPKFNLGASSTAKSVDSIDEGLRSYMLGVYNYMAVGTAITGLTAWITANTPIINLFYSLGANGQIGASPLGYLVMFAPLIFILALSFFILSAASCSSIDTTDTFVPCNILYITESGIFRTAFIILAIAMALNLHPSFNIILKSLSELSTKSS